MRPEPDVVLGRRYALVRPIAVGGMGEVWEASDTLLDRLVAVKILREEYRTAPTFLARFRAEARHAGQLSHPGIATVFDYGETPDVAFLVMELVRGQPLSELLVEQPDLPTATKLSILAESAEALQAAHDAGVVHRDVKPSNLMVTEQGRVKVTDFGIARALTSAPLTEHGQMVGTPAYVSPEQAAGGPVTGASDIYSLAAVAYEMFAGHPPFERDTPLALALAHVSDPAPRAPDTVPRSVATLIESGLAKDPSQRPASAASVARELRRELAALRPNAAPAPGPAEQDGPNPTAVMPAAGGVGGRAPTTLRGPVAPSLPSRRRSPIVTAALVLVLVLVAVTIWRVTRPSAGDNAGSVPAVSTVIGEPAAVTQPPAATQPPPTQPAATQPAPTQPAATQPPATPAPAAQPPPTQPPATPAPPPAGEPAVAAPVAASEAVTFVVDYYERVRAGDYEVTWESLSPEFRDARDLTFERYVSYWESTTLDLRDPRFVPGPGVDEGRVVFDARYDTGSRLVDQTDEITLRRYPDGRLIITAQRQV